MPLPKVQRNVQDQQGNIVPGVLGSVYNEGTGVLASLFSDDAGTVVLANPMTNDATYGSFKFYINPGHYDMTFTKPGYTFEPIYDMQVTQDVLTLGTMSAQNANAVAITGGSVLGLTELEATGFATLRSGVLVPERAGLGYGLQSNLSAGAERWNLYCGGTALNFLNGPLQVQAGVGLGLVPTANKLSIDYDRGTVQAVVIRPNADTGPGSAVFFQNAAGTPIGSITTTSAATAYNTSSDVRLKHAIAALTGALDRVRALRPVSFKWQADDSPGVGFLAHELQQTIPEAVTGEPDAVNDDGSVKPQQVDHSKLVPWLTSAVQALLARVETLEAQVAALQA
jgi:Chaperone of endosialidase